ncbi:MAG TPA: SIS domain-containing protein [Clostridia bacterium]|jgi:arabinose-5-phosphate isomerase
MRKQYKELLKNAIKSELKGVQELLAKTENQYDQVIDLIYNCQGKVVFMGVGKSGHIGRKLAATFSSTGTPSFFVHATEACHGDLGMIEKKDVVVLLSNSGNTAEVIQNLESLKKIGCKTVAFTSNPDSKLAQMCDYKLIYPKTDEADHLNLAPTVSSTLALVLGDAIACALSKLKNFAKEDFFTFHPNGALGQKLKEELK